MNLKKLTFFLLVASAAFMLLGDRVLPSPASTCSLKMRTSVNSFLVGLVPKFKPQKPDNQTEHTVDNLKP